MTVNKRMAHKSNNEVLPFTVARLPIKRVQPDDNQTIVTP